MLLIVFITMQNTQTGSYFCNGKLIYVTRWSVYRNGVLSVPTARHWLTSLSLHTATLLAPRPGSINRWSFKVLEFHYKDKTVVRPSYLYHGNSYSGKVSLYWNGPLVLSTRPTCNIHAFARYPSDYNFGRTGASSTTKNIFMKYPNI